MNYIRAIHNNHMARGEMKMTGRMRSERDHGGKVNARTKGLSWRAFLPFWISWALMCSKSMRKSGEEWKRRRRKVYENNNYKNTSFRGGLKIAGESTAGDNDPTALKSNANDKIPTATLSPISNKHISVISNANTIRIECLCVNSRHSITK